MVGVGVEQLGGAERRHLASPVDLAAEAGPEPFLVGELGLDDLDGDRPPVPRLGEVDGAHAALTEASQQAVVTEKLRVTRPQRRLHRREDY
ncbi:MAG: hypothetical protein ABW000_03100 [Actinoplanes sp.]